MENMGEVSVDRSRWKIGAIAVIGVVIAAYCGYGIALWLNEGVIGSLAIIAGFLFPVLLLLQATMMHSRSVLGGIVFAEGVALGAPIIAQSKSVEVMVVGTFITVSLLLVASVRGQRSNAESLTVSVTRVSMMALPMTITALSILFSFAYAITLRGAGELQIPKKTVIALVRPSEWIVNKFTTHFSFDESLERNIRENSGLLLKGELATLPKNVQDEALQTAIVQFRDAISETFGIATNIKEPLIDIVVRIVNSQLQKVPAEFRLPLWFGVGVIIFLTVKGIGALISILVQWAAVIMYQLLLVLGFFRVGFEERRKEIVVL